MITVVIKNFNWEILFTHSEKENTILKTLEKAVKEGSDLTEANLTVANLTGAYLTGADLTEADLTGAIWIVS